MRYQLEVDGRAATVDVDPSTPLLTVLRNDVGVAGPKLGCGQGHCGSCTVLVDGEPVRSCTRRVSSVAAGARITTVAGLGTPERPHPVQAAFIAEQALQCGYCTSGMIVAAAALLREKPHPSEDEIRGALERNLCRCGSHDRILRAVRRAAEENVEAAAALGGLALGATALARRRDDGATLPHRSRGAASLRPSGVGGQLACSLSGAEASSAPTAERTPHSPMAVGEQLACSSSGAGASADRGAERPTRRSVLGAGGFLLLGFCLAGRALAQPAAGASPPLPGSLAGAKRLDAWLRIGADGTVTVLSGKVELGQGIRTALAQIVADELDVAIERLRMISADTDLSPDEGYTSGSVSIQQSGAALRQAAAEARRILVELAASRLGVGAADLHVDDGRVSPRGGGTGAATTYWELVSETTLEVEATGRATPKRHAERRLVGRPVQRLDIPGKVFGDPVFVHDLRLPGMLHGRVVRPPSYAARLVEVDDAAARALAGVVRVVRDGSFLGVIAEREEQAESAAGALARAARWSGSVRLPAAERPADFLRRLPSRTATVSTIGADPAATATSVAIDAEYAKPFIAHASLGPSCAVALEESDPTGAGGGAAASRLRIWTHSQGVFPLRAALSKVLGVAPDRLRVTHVEGSGCYGHNGADDVACDAALLARAVPGRPVRVQWSREDELRWAPFGSAMAVRMRGGLDGDGGVAFWHSELWSHTHSTRPGREAGFVAAWHLAWPQPPPTAMNIPQPAGGEDRNAVPLYTFPSQRVVEHFVPEMPVRVSALRSLGAYANVFAIESFIDELAAAAGADPVAFRLRHLADQRARAVIETAAREAGWTAAPPISRRPDESSRDGEGRSASPERGRGFAFARYKNQAAYVAMVADVVVDRASGAIRVERVVAAVDAGDVVNPDGLRNQIEGGIVQAASWTLVEEVVFDGERVTSTDWRSYPIARFPEVPQVSVSVIDRPDDPPVGAGEAAQGPTAAAIANAVFAACGIRLRELPLRAERVRAALA